MVLPWAWGTTPLKSTVLSLFRPICPVSCLLPLTLQSAILNYLLSLELSMLSLSLECHSSPSHPPAPICLANSNISGLSPNPSHSARVPLLCPSFPLRKNWLLAVWGSIPMYIDHVSLPFLDCKLLEDNVSVTWIAVSRCSVHSRNKINILWMDSMDSIGWRTNKLKMEPELWAKAKISLMTVEQMLVIMWTKLHHNGLSAGSSAVCKAAEPQFVLVNMLGGESLEYKMTFRDRKRGWCLILAYFLSNLQKQNPAKQLPPFPKVGFGSGLSFPKYFFGQATLPML